MKCVTSIALACMFAGSEAFAPQRFGVVQQQNSKTALNAFALRADNGEDDAMFLMLKARECALSDTCSVEEAEFYLREVVHVESGCAAGTLGGKDLCDVGFAAEIVGNLRTKIEQGKTRGISTVVPAATSAAQLLSMTTAAILLTVILSTTASGDSFTVQEWFWAAKGGFLSDMLSQYFKYGGLSPIDYYDAELLPFTLQEWWWAARDGYLPDLVHHFTVNGGL
mmetsp:Transcript_12397/g.16323  ORF Transcript_12397/g.16323 Transcript_12397/m.16323 type:complete len:224 (+) Transcript_12397:221-892(+)|eukprot:CAMPEP_0195247888 /NCGR_PEP_ID=MMETSP0706-20130129/1230_1 /TAXON_ID=33640 /ORGANISM="Asterionellopsis glacialis, Strain CCMP134" /LENGTH=223 /DNA_ID=CAMNT_0040299469 /DNA_START=152 /DNA_END=823 /DNA_ORIENTATION=-